MYDLVIFNCWVCVVVEQDLQVDELNLAEIGPKFEKHVMFPARTNTG